MRTFHCDHCGGAVFFENTTCQSCGHKLAYLSDLKLVASLDEVPPTSTEPTAAPVQQDANTSAVVAPPPPPPPSLWTSPLKRAEGRTYRLCENYVKYNVCNWAIPSDDPNTLCPNCRLTQMIPDLNVAGNEEKWRRMETAKRRLVYSLMEHKLPIRSMAEDPETGLAFKFLGDPTGGPRVLTGHEDGIITMNIIEADDVERERMRVSMHEPYRTLLGHFRHEIGHYYWDRLIRDSPHLDGFRALFGDEREDYAKALQDHYELGPKRNWFESYVSEYASVHPWEDWAETWAHYLHMTDTLETAAVCGLSLKPDRPDEPAMEKQPTKPASQQRFDEIIRNWFPLTYVLNSLNRGMGLNDAYPFVLPPPTIEKLRFVHEVICQSGGE